MKQRPFPRPNTAAVRFPAHCSPVALKRVFTSQLTTANNNFIILTFGMWDRSPRWRASGRLSPARLLWTRHVALEHLKRHIASLELVQRLTSLMSKFLQIVVALLVFVLPGMATAQNPEHRIALVIGNAGYQEGALTTPANDAGLIAQTLQAAGFDVVGARDLDQDTLRRALRDFLEKAQAAGPNTIAYVYLSGYGLQLEGENY